MKQTFDYLENVPNIAATVCDKEGIVLYQNKRAIDRDGDVVGKDLPSNSVAVGNPAKVIKSL